MKETVGNSNYDPIDLIEAHVVAVATVLLCRARRRMVGHRGGHFECAAVLEVGGDPGCATAVVTELGFHSSRRGATAGPPGAMRSDQIKLWCSMILAADRCGRSETVCPSAATQVSKPLAVQDRTVVSTQKSVAHPVIITRLAFFSLSSASRCVPRKLSLAVFLIDSSPVRRSSAVKTCQPSVPGSSTSPG